MENNFTEIIAIRHGETEWNKIGKQQGHFNSNLTKEGICQAELLAAKLTNSHCDVIYSSDLGRAVQTAEIIGKELNMRVMQEYGLRERNLGIMQGLTIDEFKRIYPEEYKRFKSNDPEYIIPNGESIKQRYMRTINSLHEIVAKNINKKILVVMHGGNLDSLIRFVLNIPLNQERKFSLFNSSLNTFVVQNDVWMLKSWGDISHLDGVAALDDF